MDDRPTPMSPRLRLRLPAPRDAHTIERLAGDRRVADTTESMPHPLPPGATLAWIEGRARARREEGSLALASTRRESGEFPGVVSLDRREDGRVAELGYWIAVDCWNQGYATEAAGTLLAYGFDNLDLSRVTARCLVRNPASARVMKKTGLRRRDRLAAGTINRGVPEDVDVYELTAAESAS